MSTELPEMPQPLDYGPSREGLMDFYDDKVAALLARIRALDEAWKPVGELLLAKERGERPDWSVVEAQFKALLVLKDQLISEGVLP